MPLSTAEKNFVDKILDETDSETTLNYLAICRKMNVEPNIKEYQQIREELNEYVWGKENDV